MNYEPLLPVLLAYMTTQESYKIAKRATKTRETKIRQRLLQRTHLETKTVIDAEGIIEDSKEETDALFVLGIWAAFERFIRDDLQKRGQILCHSNPPILGSAIYKQLEKEIEFWKPAEMLDCLKESLFKDKMNLIGHAKQVLAYRDWVAHGKNPKNPPSTDMQPLSAYNTLNEIVETLLHYPPNQPNI